MKILDIFELFRIFEELDVKGKIIYIVVGTIIIAISVFLACLVSARLDSQREYEENLEKRVRDLEEKQWVI